MPRQRRHKLVWLLRATPIRTEDAHSIADKWCVWLTTSLFPVTRIERPLLAGKLADDVLRDGLNEMIKASELMATKLETAIPTAKLPDLLERPGGYEGGSGGMGA